MSSYEQWEKNTHRRHDRQGLVEHLCEHGVGHPNPGSALWIAQTHSANETLSRETILSRFDSEMVHGCDGCCSDPEFPAFRDSLMMAHDMIRALQTSLRNISQGDLNGTSNSNRNDHSLGSNPDSQERVVLGRTTSSQPTP